MNSASPLVEGFRAAFAEFDTSEKVTMTIPPQSVIDERARFYRVDPRTVRRWISAGVDISDPKAIALLLLTQKNPAPQALEQILTELEE